MKIEECFSLFTRAVKDYNPYYSNVGYSISESETKDYLVCDIARVIGHQTHKSIKTIADIIVNNLPFSATVLDNGDIKFYLWQEVQHG